MTLIEIAIVSYSLLAAFALGSWAALCFRIDKEEWDNLSANWWDI